MKFNEIYGYEFVKNCRAAEFVYAPCTRIQNYSYVRHFEICCTCMCLKCCLCKYAGQEAYIIFACIALLFATLNILIFSSITKSPKKLKIFDIFVKSHLLSSSPSEAFLKNVFEKLQQSTGQQPCRIVTLAVEISLRCGCSPKCLLCIFKTLFYKNTSWSLLLSV